MKQSLLVAALLDKPETVFKKYTLIPAEDGWFRLKALKSFSFVAEGDIGGYVRGEHNLSQRDNCWVADDARVGDDARVEDDALVTGTAQVLNQARLTQSAQVCGNAVVENFVQMSGFSRVSGQVSLSGNAKLSGSSWVTENAKISGDVTLVDWAEVHGSAKVSGLVRLSGSAYVGEHADVRGADSDGGISIGEHGAVYGHARVRGNVHIWGNAKLRGDACARGKATLSGDCRIGGKMVIDGDAYISGRTELCGDMGIVSTGAVITSPAGYAAITVPDGEIVVYTREEGTAWLLYGVEDNIPVFTPAELCKRYPDYVKSIEWLSAHFEKQAARTNHPNKVK